MEALVDYVDVDTVKRVTLSAVTYVVGRWAYKRFRGLLLPPLYESMSENRLQKQLITRYLSNLPSLLVGTMGVGITAPLTQPPVALAIVLSTVSLALAGSVSTHLQRAMFLKDDRASASTFRAALTGLLLVLAHTAVVAVSTVWSASNLNDAEDLVLHILKFLPSSLIMLHVQPLLILLQARSFLGPDVITPSLVMKWTRLRELLMNLYLLLCPAFLLATDVKCGWHLLALASAIFNIIHSPQFFRVRPLNADRSRQSVLALGATTQHGHLADDQSINAVASHIVSTLSLKEKFSLVGGQTNYFVTFWRLLALSVQHWAAAALKPGKRSQATNDLLRPGLLFSDGPRGVFAGHCTAFPVAMARAATFDPELEKLIGEAMGIEARMQNIDWIGAPCINLLRHPGWGRAQETYGEDSLLLGRMGAASVRGLEKYVLSCVKHLACNSLENTRFTVDVKIDEKTLRTEYLPHFFDAAVATRCASVMTAYNHVNGQRCSENETLVKQILKREWCFEGLVVSDWMMGVRDGKASLLAGTDMEMPWKKYTNRAKELVERAEGSSTASEDEIAVANALKDAAKDSALRIVRQSIRARHLDSANVPTETKTTWPALTDIGEQHRLLARRAATEAIVLLKNKTNLLPLDTSRVRHLCVLGHIAAQENVGDHGSSMVSCPAIITPLEAMKTTMARASSDSVKISYDYGNNLGRCKQMSRQADATVVFVGYSPAEEGEYIPLPTGTRGGDRSSLSLPQRDLDLIAAACEGSENVCVVVCSGSGVLMQPWSNDVASILAAWYGGSEGGQAIADVLFGLACPTGRLPCSFPDQDTQMPAFDCNANAITYESPVAYMRPDAAAMRYPFGHGLMYTAVEITDVNVTPGSGARSDILQKTRENAIDFERAFAQVTATVVPNEAPKADDAVVFQVYVRYLDGGDDEVRRLAWFHKVKLPAKAHHPVSVTMHVPISRIVAWVEGNTWRLRSGRYEISVATSSRPDGVLSKSVVTVA